MELFNDCKSDIYGYRAEYYLDGKAVGGMTSVHADESILSKTDFLELNFYENYFPENSDLGLFQFQISVLDQKMNESEFTDIISLPAEYGKSYDVRISGSFESGFSVVRE